MTPDVVVCGAGVGGLASAHALSALGLSVLVLDRRSGPADVAKGELLQPEAVRILDDWGLLADVRATGAVPVGRLTIRGPSGAAVLDLDYGPLPGSYRQILCTEYATLLRVLARRLDPGVQVRRGVLVEGVLRDATGRVTGVRTAGRDVPARLVVAADGLSSRLRKDVGVRTRRQPYDHRLVAFDLAGVPVADEVSAYLTDRGLRLVYPLPGGRCRLYVQVGPDELRRGPIARWVDGVLAGMPALEPLAGALRASLHSRQVLGVCRLRAHRLAVPGLALVGESAHAVHPMAAQGMNSSLADAQTLAAALTQAGDAGLEPAAVDRALREYHAVRQPRLDHTATVSHNAARMLTLTAGLGRRMGRRMMRHTASNPRLLRITAGNLAGVAIRPLTPVDRLYQLGLLTDRSAHAAAQPVCGTGGSR